jgi:hypothetical protein
VKNIKNSNVKQEPYAPEEKLQSASDSSNAENTDRLVIGTYITSFENFRLANFNRVKKILI